MSSAAGSEPAGSEPAASTPTSPTPTGPTPTGPTPTSRAQFEAFEAFAVPGLEQVRDDVWALGLAMDGDHLPASLLYLLRDTDGGFHIVDPGTDSDANFARLETALASLGAALTDIRSITATHLHPDHLGMGGRIRDASRAPLQLSSLEARAVRRLHAQRLDAEGIAALAEAWGVPGHRRAELTATAERSPGPAPAIDRILEDGDTLDVPGFTLIAMLTPGHTPGHLSLRDDERGILFTGDHILPATFGGLGLGGESDTNPLADYVASVDRIAAFGSHEALPGHGYRFTGLGERARESATHHLRRTAEVEAVVAVDPAAGVWEIASQLTWTAGWPNLTGFFLFSALSQTAMHRDYVRARRG